MKLLSTMNNVKIISMQMESTRVLYKQYTIIWDMEKW